MKSLVFMGLILILTIIAAGCADQGTITTQNNTDLTPIVSETVTAPTLNTVSVDFAQAYKNADRVLRGYALIKSYRQVMDYTYMKEKFPTGFVLNVPEWIQKRYTDADYNNIKIQVVGFGKDGLDQYSLSPILLIDGNWYIDDIHTPMVAQRIWVEDTHSLDGDPPRVLSLHGALHQYGITHTGIPLVKTSGLPKYERGDVLCRITWEWKKIVVDHYDMDNKSHILMPITEEYTRFGSSIQVLDDIHTPVVQPELWVESAYTKVSHIDLDTIEKASVICSQSGLRPPSDPHDYFSYLPTQIKN